jgi:hypothetical protein
LQGHGGDIEPRLHTKHTETPTLAARTQQKTTTHYTSGGNGPTTKETYVSKVNYIKNITIFYTLQIKEINGHTSTTNYMKNTHTAEDYANRSHKEIEPDSTKFNRATSFILNFNRNFNLKIERSSEVNSLA